MASERIKYVRVSRDKSNGTKQVAGYIRVNGDEQTKNSSEERQRIAICDYYSAMGWDLGEIYVDEGHSARGEEIETRAGHLRMMAAIEEGQYDVVVTYTLDRISHDATRMCDTIKACKQNGVAVVSIKENLDSSGPMGQAALQLFCCGSTDAIRNHPILRRERQNLMYFRGESFRMIPLCKCRHSVAYRNGLTERIH